MCAHFWIFHIAHWLPSNTVVLTKENRRTLDTFWYLWYLTPPFCGRSEEGIDLWHIGLSTNGEVR